MRCLTCGGDMRLQRVRPDEAIAVAGYEIETFACASCGEAEDRHVFRGERASAVSVARVAAAQVAADIAPAQVAPAQVAPAQGSLSHASPSLVSPSLVAPSQVSRAEIASAGIVQVDPVPAARASPEVSTTPMSPAGAAPAQPSVADPALPASAAVAQGFQNEQGQPAAQPGTTKTPQFATSQIAAEGEEAVEMLRRAIEMVRSPVRGGPLRGLTDCRPVPPVVAPGPSRGSGRLIQIRHDPSFDAAYAAEDSRSGLVVLRHQDKVRLRAMCERLGWRIIEDGAPSRR